ncbi:PRC-barrel domain-containing protein [Siccirubricoccus phaeus]|uniref:PRC-barrel domain-containing protein n=1 Tax=Siccirubricoccus phaeus TaxID=2595053 RepID=UPI001A9C5FB4|nr:PRC-barrel domain-containing protein [Siccirubricoccus phaeus]
MTQRQSLLAMTAAAALLALPAFAQQNNGTGTAPRDASGGVLAQQQREVTPRDGTTGNPPPAAAPQRGAETSPPDGTPGNPPGTAAGRATDRALGTNMSGAHPENDRSATGAGATTGTMPVDSMAAANGRRASKLIGSSVYNENNESIGSVDDILIPPGGGQPVAVLSVGGFLGIGAKLVAVPYERLQTTQNGQRWTMAGATKDSLTQLPSFSYDQSAERRG